MSSDGKYSDLDGLSPQKHTDDEQMAATTLPSGEPASEDTSLYPIAVLIDELKNEDVQVLTTPTCFIVYRVHCTINNNNNNE